MKIVYRLDRWSWLNLMRDKKISIRTMAITGLRKKRAPFIGPNTVELLVNNFPASAPGCKAPKAPTLLGPTRNCLIERAFRSKRVISATLINTLKVTNSNSSTV